MTVTKTFLPIFSLFFFFIKDYSIYKAVIVPYSSHALTLFGFYHNMIQLTQGGIQCHDFLPLHGIQYFQNDRTSCENVVHRNPIPDK